MYAMEFIRCGRFNSIMKLTAFHIVIKTHSKLRCNIRQHAILSNIYKYHNLFRPIPSFCS